MNSLILAVAFAKRVHVECEYLYLCRRQALVPCRHVSPPAAMDGRDDSFEVAAIQPAFVREVGGADILFAARVFAMTGDAVLEEDIPASGDRLDVSWLREFRIAE